MISVNCNFICTASDIWWGLHNDAFCALISGRISYVQLFQTAFCYGVASVAFESKQLQESKHCKSEIVQYVHVSSSRQDLYFSKCFKRCWLSDICLFNIVPMMIEDIILYIPGKQDIIKDSRRLDSKLNKLKTIRVISEMEVCVLFFFVYFFVVVLTKNIFYSKDELSSQLFWVNICFYTNHVLPIFLKGAINTGAGYSSGYYSPLWEVYVMNDFFLYVCVHLRPSAFSGGFFFQTSLLISSYPTTDLSCTLVLYRRMPERF